MSSFLVNSHTTEVRPYARMRLCCPHRQHFRACPSPAPTVTEQLIHNGFVAWLFIRTNEDRAGFRFYVSILSSHAAALTPGSRSVLVPITSRSTLAFAQNVEARRVACCCRFIPVHPTLPVIRVGGDLSRSCSVHS